MKTKQTSEIQLLLDNRFAPVTTTLCFIEAPLNDAVEAYIQLLEKDYATQFPEKNISFTKTLLQTTLENALLKLEPLTGYDRKRFLFIPTHSTWTAYFDNGIAGTEIHALRALGLTTLKCRTLRVIAQPRLRVGHGLALILEIYEPTANDPMGIRRSIALTNDDLPFVWEFDNYGEPFDFEDVQRYSARRKKDRFTFEMLRNYLAALGLMPFDASFYLPEAILLEKQGNLNITSELSIAEAKTYL